ncbi:MAG TPA: YcgN family cysteine cluster protein [Afipia sp.]
MTQPPRPPSTQSESFWKTKTLEEMSDGEWESLCDGCARCCLEKLEDEDTGKIYFTHISCKLLDEGSCGCKDYPNRSDKVPDCVRLTPENVRTLNWLPPSCGYKLVAEGRDLYWWHPLISGDPNTVHEAGVSVRGRVWGTEDEIEPADLEDHIVQWPGVLPRRAKLKHAPDPAKLARERIRRSQSR